MSQVTNQQFKERGFPMPTFISRAFDTLIALLLASILGTILLGVSAVFAMDGSDSAFTFGDDGRMQMNGAWSPSNRSRDFEYDRQMYNRHQSEEALRYNDETVRSYHAPRSNQPTYTDPNPIFGVHGPDGKMRLCQRSFDRVFCN